MEVKKMTDVKSQVERYFLNKYPNIKLFGKKCFILPNGFIARVDTITWGDERCIVIEYADNMQQAEHNLFDDGDSYQPSAYSSVDDLIKDLEKEALA